MKALRVGLLALTSAAWAAEPGRRAVTILAKRCMSCHDDELKAGELSLSSRENALKGGSHGPAIAPGKPEASLLIHAVRQDGELKMPPGAKLSPRDIEVLVDWVRRGAPWVVPKNQIAPTASRQGLSTVINQVPSSCRRSIAE